MVTTILAFTSCTNAGSDRVLSIEATATVEGLVYFDADGSRTLNSGDEALSGVRVWLIVGGTVDTVATSTSDADGLYSVRDVPVGRYTVAVDESSIGDTVGVARIDTTDFSVEPGDSTSVSIAVSFPKLTVQEFRTAATGTKAFVEGVALTGLGIYGDTTLHVADTSGAIRATRIARTDVFAGDSIRLRGVRSERDGEPVLSNVTVFVIGVTASLPPASQITTGTAAGAEGGVLDAGFVHIVDAAVTRTQTTPEGDLELTVDDGSGPLIVRFDADIAFDLGQFALPGAELDAFGVLVPTGTGSWVLKPRSDADAALTIPVKSTVEVRSLPLGTRVFVDGIALHDRQGTSGLFGDRTLSIADTSGAIRAIRMARQDVFEGDSVRIAGSVGRQDGQIVIDSAVPFVLGLAEVPAPVPITTDQAVGADGGALDAALVKVSAATVSDTLTQTADATSGRQAGFVIQVADTSGTTLDVLIDSDAGIAIDAAWVPGAVLDVTGLLVPDPEVAGVWQLKPRVVGDVVVHQ